MPLQEKHFRSPHEWVVAVKTHLEQRLNVSISSVYKRAATEPDGAEVSYLVGEVDTPSGFSGDGRQVHNIELRVVVEIPTSIEDFDLVALNLSTRIEREVINRRFGELEDGEEVVPVSNLPSKFDPETGVFARTVTFRQMLRMGPLEADYHEIIGACDHANPTDATCEFAGTAGSGAAAGIGRAEANQCQSEPVGRGS